MARSLSGKVQVLKRKIAKAERWALQAERESAAAQERARKERTRQLCILGGEVVKAGLGNLSPEELRGLLLEVATKHRLPERLLQIDDQPKAVSSDWRPEIGVVELDDDPPAATIRKREDSRSVGLLPLSGAPQESVEEVEIDDGPRVPSARARRFDQQAQSHGVPAVPAIGLIPNGRMIPTILRFDSWIDRKLSLALKELGLRFDAKVQQWHGEADPSAVVATVLSERPEAWQIKVPAAGSDWLGPEAFHPAGNTSTRQLPGDRTAS